MRYSTSGMILAAMSIGEAMAGPTHAHLHRRAHEKKAVDYKTMDWDNMGVDWASAYAAGQASKTAVASPAVATPAVVAAVKASTSAVVASSAPAAKSSSAASSSASSGSSTTNSASGSLFGGIAGASNKLTSFGTATKPLGSTNNNAEGVAYCGNYGSPYGSNIILVDSVGSHAFTNTFKNTQSETITVNVWNKVGPNVANYGDITKLDAATVALFANSGQSLAPKQTTLTFTLAPGASQVVAFQDNTQAGWAQPVSSYTPASAFQTTWGEANFVSTGSGYDVSAINNPTNNYAMTITSKENSGCTSDKTQNFWLTDSKPIGGSDGSCYVPGSTMTLQTVMGGTS